MNSSEMREHQSCTVVEMNSSGSHFQCDYFMHGKLLKFSETSQRRARGHSDSDM